MDPRVEKIVLQLHMESDDVRVIGISGIGGIGKTTIAKVLYNQLSCEFEYMSFIENVKENIETRGLIYLQTQLLCDILEEGENQNISSVGQGASMIKKILQSKRVLIILDDVDDSDQLEYLVGNRCWLGKGSRVIITTRYKHLLTVQEVDDSYEVEELDFDQSRKLLIWHAFKNSPPMQKYMDLLDRLLCYCEGLPLALKVLGSLLIKKAVPQWESQLDKWEREPEQKIYKVLKVSFDDLDHTQKQIFLDIACFLKGEDQDVVSRILDSCNLYAKSGIGVLCDRSLITISHNKIDMHHLIQRMGWEIVRKEFPDEPQKWSRLWDPDDIYHALTVNEVCRCQKHNLISTSLKHSKYHTISFLFEKLHIHMI